MKNLFMISAILFSINASASYSRCSVYCTYAVDKNNPEAIQEGKNGKIYVLPPVSILNNDGEDLAAVFSSTKTACLNALELRGKAGLENLSKSKIIIYGVQTLMDDIANNGTRDLRDEDLTPYRLDGSENDLNKACTSNLSP